MDEFLLRLEGIGQAEFVFENLEPGFEGGDSRSFTLGELVDEKVEVVGDGVVGGFDRNRKAYKRFDANSCLDRISEPAPEFEVLLEIGAAIRPGKSKWLGVKEIVSRESLRRCDVERRFDTTYEVVVPEIFVVRWGLNAVLVVLGKTAPIAAGTPESRNWGGQHGD